MKKIIALFCVCVVLHHTYAQEKVKFGDISNEELSMTYYEKDSLAPAVVLYENCLVFYSMLRNDFSVVTEHTVRIKILTNDGIDNANISIPFYEGATRDMNEVISGLTAYTYNLENGKIQKEKLSKNYIFTENVSTNLKRLKFAMPSVKVGSVIEYKYTLTSPYYYSIEDHKFQREIPVKYSRYEIRIPEYFVFNKELKGFEPIKVDVKNENQTLMFGTQTLTCTAEVISAEVTDLPALKEENYLWSTRDYMSGIFFEIRKVEIAGSYYKDYTRTWGDIASQLMSSDIFGKQMNFKNLFKEELTPIINSEASNRKKIRNILDMVRGKVKWNEKRTLSAENVKKALKEGVGTSGELNALLICALKDAGFKAYPVAMSLRSRGRIPHTYPSLNNLNYFIVGVILDDKPCYLDATQTYSDINIIPVDCLVERAFCVQDGKFTWENLTNIDKNRTNTNLLISFDEQGVLSGKYMKVYLGEPIYVFQQARKATKDQDEYIEKEASVNEIQLSDYAFSETKEKTASAMESYFFTKEDIRIGEEEVISFNPLLFTAMKSNPFKSERRQLPVEFSFPYESRVTIALTIPPGYVVDEAPGSVKYVYNDDHASFTYIVTQKEQALQIMYQFALNVSIVPATDYEILRDFWSKVFAKTNEPITLKKVAQ